MQNVRVLQFLATSVLRRNQSELIPYSAMYTLFFGNELGT